MKLRKFKIPKIRIRTISSKIRFLYGINIVYILMMMTAVLYIYNNLNGKFGLLNKYNEQNSSALQLDNLLIRSSSETMNIIYNKKDDLVANLFARNEDIFNIFDEFKGTAEKYDFSENVNFATENEPVIMEIRTNIVTCINMYKNGRLEEAVKFYNLRIDNKIKKLEEFVSDSIYKNKVAIDLINKEIKKTERSSAIILAVSLLVVIVINILLGGILKHSIIKPIKSLINMLKNAKGDLTVQLKLNSKDELSDMAEYFNTFIKTIHDMVVKVIVSVQNISDSIDQISKGNLDLSRRTMDQASSLEEIASTLEESAAAIKQIASNSKAADDLSTDTCKVAENGKGLVMQAAEAISGIKNASEQIGKIITVINNIAFQTNMLSINARIEAARAGENGKSFAVVAREIQRLAYGSGSAAKEIGNFIGGSVGKILNVVELAGRSSEALKSIVEEIYRVENLVSEISTASHEEKTGIDQINLAVSDMNKITQQNSSLAEEISSESETMAKNMQELLSLVKEFKIKEGSEADFIVKDILQPVQEKIEPLPYIIKTQEVKLDNNEVKDFEEF